MTARATRRALLGGLAATVAAPALGGTRPSVIVVGGGFGGASAARELAAHDLAVTLIEPSEHYVSCPSSNAVIAGLKPMSALTFGYDGLRKAGIAVRHDSVVAIDGARRVVQLSAGDEMSYDRLVVSPGVALRFDAIPGYDAAASVRMPHAWKAGAQTELLMRQLDAMADGGLVVVSAPEMPYRCPPGPYERASLIAHVLKERKPRSKVIVLDAKDKFSKQPLFEAAWKTLYPDHLEWVPRAKGGNLVRVDTQSMTVEAEVGRFKVAVASIIPPQHAPELCFSAGLADAYGWCRIDPISFESIRVPGVHVLGDACANGAMPKSAFSANAQARVCAKAVADLLLQRKPAAAKLINTCYSLAAPDYAFSISGVYAPEWDQLVTVPGSGGLSPDDAPREVRSREAILADDWYRAFTRSVFG